MGERMLWFGVMSLLVALGCSVDDSTSEEVESPGSEEAVALEGLRFATYNAGLADQFVSYAAERQGPIAAALGQIEADVLCVQEVWNQEDIDTLVDASKETFPHVHYQFTEEDLSDVQPACTADAVEPLEACIQANCAETDNLTDCGIEFCIAEFTSLETTCQGCVASNLNLGVEGVLSACVESGGSLSYGGHNGLLLLSRVELRNPSFELLPSFLVQRGWLWAEVGDFTVACTHVATGLPVEYAGEFESYEDEQAGQLGLILAGLENVEGPIVLLGDMNNGPEKGGLAGSVVENWDLFAEAGFTDPNMEQEVPLCSWCADNTLSESTSDRAIDHILLRGATGTDVFRFLDGTVEITVGEETLTSSYSDHYGLGATVVPLAE